MHRKDIKDFTLKELEDIFAKKGEPPYRATQVFYWIYKKGVDGFGGMKNLPPGLIGRLRQDYYIGKLQLYRSFKSDDGTVKFVFGLPDANPIETVLICSHARRTVCISTQIGCKFRCPFCASGQRGFVRNLRSSEMLNQILFLPHGLKDKITNCVFMGMGEPLDNYTNLTKALLIMNEPKAMAIGARRITVSTCGLPPGIKKLADFQPQVNLSISFHAAEDKLRNELVPVNKRYPLHELIEACREYIRKTKRQITLEYVLIKDKNHSLQDAHRLAAIARRLRAKVNVMTYNPIADVAFQAPNKSDIDVFLKSLRDKGADVTFRRSKGGDIRAGCGQLAGQGSFISPSG